MLVLNLTLFLLTLSNPLTAQVSTSLTQQTVQEKPVLLLFYSSRCPYSQSVLSYLQRIHKQVPMKNVVNNPSAKEELKKLGGEMLVPCLLIDGQPLYNSDEIIRWLSKHQDLLDPD